jgi:flagellar biosynthesis protein FlhG
MAELWPARESERIAPPLGVRHVIAVGGARGGVGTSMLAVNIGVYLAQLGRSVVLVDADSSGAELHTMLGIDLPAGAAPASPAEGRRPQTTPSDDDDADLSTVQTRVPGLLLSPQRYSIGSTAPTRPGRKPRWARRLRQLAADYVILDLGAGTSPATLDLFLLADFDLCLAAPEPTSVEATYRLCRALFQRQIRRTLLKDRYRMRLVERAQAELEPLPSPLELVRAIARYDMSTAELAAAELAQLRPRLVVNGARLRTDGELGPAIADLSKRYLGVALDYVGFIEHDDSVWLSVLRRRPLLIDNPTSKSARSVERIARRVLALATTREQKPDEPIPVVPNELNLYDVLWTQPSASDEELRRAYRRQREIFQPASLPLTSLFSEPMLRTELGRIEEAHDTLLDPIRRRAYDISTFPEQQEPQPKPNVLNDSALAAERAMLRKELEREINAESEFTGVLLRKVRESKGVEVEEIAKHTKISSAHLRAIEAEDFANLPAMVYTRGFVQQLAKFLGLDSAQVTRTYLRRLRQWRAASGGDAAP